MALTPEEIRHVSLRRRVRGYNRRDTDRLLAEIAESYESVWNQRASLYDDLKQVQAELEEAQQRERLRNAEETDLRARVERDEAELATLHKDAERLETDRGAHRAEVQRAHAELDELRGDIERLKAERNLEREERQRAIDELAKLREEVARLRADRGRSADELRRSSAEAAELREEVARLEGERDRLADQSQGSSAEVAQLREEVARLEGERDRVADQSQGSSAEAAQLREEVARLEAERARVLQESARMRADLVELRRTEEGRETELADLRREVIEILRLLEGETHVRYRDLLTSARELQDNEGEAEPRSGGQMLSDLRGDVEKPESERARLGDQMQELEQAGVRDQVGRRLWELLIEHLRLFDGETGRAGRPDLSPSTHAHPRSENQKKAVTGKHEREGEGQGARTDTKHHPAVHESAGDPLDRGTFGL